MRARSLVGVATVAFLVRLAYLLSWRGSLLDEVLLGDARTFDAWGRQLSAGNWMGSEVFYQAPLYPYLLGVLYTLVGRDLLLVRVLQSLASAVACALGAASGARLGGARAGWASGLLGALYLPWVWADGLLQKTSLALFLSALLVWLVLESFDRASRGRLVCVGSALGLLALTRENALILAPVLLLLLRRRNPEAPRAAWLLAGLALVLLPVAVRNAALGGAPLPTASNFGVNLYLGNGRGADGLYVPLVEGRGHADFERRDAERIASAAAGRELSPSEVSLHFLGRSASEIADDPGRWLGLLVRKLRWSLDRREPMDTEALEAYAAHLGPLAGWRHLGGFALLFALSMVGLRELREDPRARALALLAGSLVLSLVLVFVAARFRLGLVPWLLPLAGVGAVALFRSPNAGRIASATIACGATFLGPNLEGDPASTTWANLTSELLRRGRFDEALRAGEHAIELDPESAQARFNRGLAARYLSQDDLARADFQRVVADEGPFRADALAELGALAARAGEEREAQRLLGEALQANADHAQANYYFGVLLRGRGDAEGAAAAYERARRADPRFAEPRHNLAILRDEAGAFEDALALLYEALAADPTYRPSRIRLAWIRAAAHDPRFRDAMEALELIRDLRRDPATTTAEVELLYAVALAEAERFPEAQQACNAALGHFPGDAGLERAARLFAAGQRWSP